MNLIRYDFWKMMILTILIHLLLTLSAINADSFLFDENYFCTFSCGRKHTACKHKCSVSGRCGEDAKDSSLNDTTRRWVVEIHNDIRNNFAIQKIKSNMKTINYDKELEFVAQCWSNTCNTTHDLCRTTSKYKDVEQNLYVRSSSKPIASYNRSELELAIRIWFTDNKTDEQLRTSNIIQHAIHGIWSNTSHVGCGCTIAKNNGQHLLYFYCNYGPAVDTTIRPMYSDGKPCSECDEPCNNKYVGLCGDIQNVKDDRWTSPYIFHRMGVLIKRSNDGNTPSIEVILNSIFLILFLYI